MYNKYHLSGGEEDCKTKTLSSGVIMSWKGMRWVGDQDVLIDIRERLVRVETKLDTQNGLREKVEFIENKTTETEARSKSNTHRIDKLEANNTWLWRTVVGAIISAGIAALAIFK